MTDGPLEIPVMLLAPGARLPERAYEHDAAFDLFSAEDAIVAPQHRQVIGTGVALGLSPGVAALTLPRSGLAAEHGVALVNAPGLIDPGYRGEVRIILLNTDRHHPFHVRVGDRIAQLLIVSLTPASLFETVQLDATERGGRGFGSSGLGSGGSATGEHGSDELGSGGTGSTGTGSTGTGASGSESSGTGSSGSESGGTAPT